MKTGVTLIDDKGRAWTVGRPVDRTAWSSSWLVRNEAGREAVLEVPLGSPDLGDDDAAEAAAAVGEVIELLRKGALPWLPRLQAEIRIPDGRPAYLIPKLGPALEDKLRSGARFAETVRLVAAVARTLEGTASSGRVHGNLRASNVFVDEHGEPVLTGPLTPRSARLQARLRAPTPHLPPEAGEVAAPSWDTWSLAVLLYRAAMAGPEGNPDAEIPAAGLDKVGLATVRDRVIERLNAEGSNGRFVSRVADRLGALLNRGLSPESQPSPPYRFAHVSALRPRLDEVDALLHPRIDSVGKLLLAPHAASGVYKGGEVVEFSVSVGCSQGVGDAEDIVTGIRVLDLDDAEHSRVTVGESRFTVRTHPSGRLRFDFTLIDVPPGRYRAEVAFAIRDSGAEPVAATADLEVRPPPGWVPPAPEPEPEGAVDFAAARARRDAPGPVPAAQPDAAAAVSEDAAYIFPQPVAPSIPGFDDDLGDDPDEAAPAPGGAPTAVPISRASASEADTTGTSPVEPRSGIELPHPGWTPPVIDDNPTRPAEFSGPGEWEALPGPEEGLPLHTGDLLPPVGGEDLPMTEDLEPPRALAFLDSLPPQLTALVDAVRKDTYTAVMAGVGAMLVLLVLVFILLRACS